MNEKNTTNLYYKGLTYPRYKRLPVYEKKKINNTKEKNMKFNKPCLNT